MRPRSAARYALRLGGLLVVLGGLFGMHGLDSHGGAAMDAMSHAAMDVPSVGAALAHHGVPGTGHVSTAVTAVAGDAGDVVAAMASSMGHPGIGMSAAVMCMAVLVLSLLLFIMASSPAGSAHCCGSQPDRRTPR